MFIEKDVLCWEGAAGNWDSQDIHYGGCHCWFNIYKSSSLYWGQFYLERFSLENFETIRKILPFGHFDTLEEAKQVCLDYYNKVIDVH